MEKTNRIQSIIKCVNSHSDVRGNISKVDECESFGMLYNSKGWTKPTGEKAFLEVDTKLYPLEIGLNHKLAGIPLGDLYGWNKPWVAVFLQDTSTEPPTYSSPPHLIDSIRGVTPIYTGLIEHFINDGFKEYREPVWLRPLILDESRARLCYQPIEEGKEEEQVGRLFGIAKSLIRRITNQEVNTKVRELEELLKE